MISTIPLTMRAAQLDSYGKNGDIVVREIPVPQPNSREVLVRVHGSSINGGEMLFIRGDLRAMTGRRFPKGLGMDFAGTVAALGSGSTKLRTGERVWGLLPSIPTWRRHASGAAAEYLVVSESYVQPLSDVISLDDAAVLPVVGPTAVRAVNTAHIGRGDRVLVRGAAGGVGSLMVQLAHAAGGNVTALASARNRTFVTGLGTDHVLDYHQTQPDKLPRFDVILDTVGSDLGRYRQQLSSGGRMVAVALNPPLPGLSALLVSLIHGKRRIQFSRKYPDAKDYDALTAEIEAGHLKAVISRQVTLDDVAAAYRSALNGGSDGKTLLKVAALE